MMTIDDISTVYTCIYMYLYFHPVHSASIYKIKRFFQVFICAISKNETYVHAFSTLRKVPSFMVE